MIYEILVGMGVLISIGYLLYYIGVLGRWIFKEKHRAEGFAKLIAFIFMGGAILYISYEIGKFIMEII